MGQQAGLDVSVTSTNSHRPSSLARAKAGSKRWSANGVARPDEAAFGTAAES
jgi:hypothetical protein